MSKKSNYTEHEIDILFKYEDYAADDMPSILCHLCKTIRSRSSIMTKKRSLGLKNYTKGHGKRYDYSKDNEPNVEF